MLNFIPYFAARNQAKAKAKARAEFISQLRAGFACLNEIHECMLVKLGADMANITPENIKVATEVAFALHEVAKALPKQ